MVSQRGRARRRSSGLRPRQAGVSGRVRGENALPWVLRSGDGFLLPLELFLVNRALREKAGRRPRREPVPWDARGRGRVLRSPGLPGDRLWQEASDGFSVWSRGRAWPLAAVSRAVFARAPWARPHRISRLPRIQLGWCSDGSKGKRSIREKHPCFLGPDPLALPVILLAVDDSYGLAGLVLVLGCIGEHSLCLVAWVS